MQPATPEAYRLLHNGVLAFAAMEAAGIRIDTDYLEQAITETDGRIAAIEARLREHEIFQVWRKVYGAATNINSREQLGHILFNELGYEAKEFTEATAEAENEEDRRPKVNEAALERINIGFVKGYLKRAKLQKLSGTYLHGLRGETVNGWLHPFFNLHTVETFRSSSDSPNFQNIPIRNPEIGNIIRRAFIAPPGYRLVEMDYSAIEVRVAACYHQDPTMLRYIAEGYDMHRDMGAECYKLAAPGKDADEAWKKNFKAIRQQAKALFVFAQFYGDWYKSCAAALYDAIDRHKLCGPDGASLHTHLGRMGIGGREAFEGHIQKVEDRFWHERFPVYDAWRKQLHADYKKRGYLHTLTGFLIQGVYPKNFIINVPVQGSAFHCLLWSVIEVAKEAKRLKMRSRPIAQIHDSKVSYAHVDEFEDYVAMSREIMTKRLREVWPWIVTPLEVEVEAAPEGGSWADKAPVKIA